MADLFACGLDTFTQIMNIGGFFWGVGGVQGDLWKKILMADLPHCWEKSRHILLYALAELLKVLSKLNFCKSYCIKN